MILFDTHFHCSETETPETFMARCNADLQLNAGLFSAPPEKFYLMAAVSDHRESEEALRFTQAVPNAVFSCGVHPQNAAEYLQNPADFSPFRNEKKLAAIGEIGLDYFYNPDDRAEQRKVLDEFLALALEWQLPAMLHLRDADGRRDAYADALAALTGFAGAGGRFVIHCYAGNAADAEKFLALGGMIGVTGLVTFKAADNVREALKVVPNERLLIETDSPYLTPVPYRGRPNSPGMVALVAAKLGAERKMAPDEAAQLFSENGLKFYNVSEKTES